MKEFKDKVAVITGASSGIGRALAERCAQEGMKVVLADIEEKALAQTEKEMKEARASVLAILTDVSKARDVEALAQKTLDAFGEVHLLCNNAGVHVATSVWESSIADWQWVMGVNLWGVIHGVRVFVPIMIEQDTECHIVNTASLAGLFSPPYQGSYNVTKFGVVSLSETLYHELALIGAKIKVSVLCPGSVKTRVMDSDRNRPPELRNEKAEEMMIRIMTRPRFEAVLEFVREGVRTGMSPQQAADIVFNAIKEEKFYILTHPEARIMVQMRMEDILQERSPTSPLIFADLGD